MTQFSILDLAPIKQGSNATEALQNCLDLAQHAEVFGFERFWVAEHHNMQGIASAATAVVIGHDWGAPTAWSTALFHPDKVSAVGALSVPFSPRAEAPPLDTLKAIFKDMFFLYSH